MTNIADASGALHDTTNGRFAGHLKTESDTGAVLAVKPVPGPMRVLDLQPGDIIWVDHNPVSVQAVQASVFEAEVRDTTGKVHTFDLPWFADQPRTVTGLRGPLASFDDVDWAEREDLDLYEQDAGWHGTLVRYNDDGYGQVSTFLSGCGNFGWHGRHYLSDLRRSDLQRLGLDPDIVDPVSYARFDADEALPDGRTKGEAFEEWMGEVAGRAIVDGIIERYGCDLFGFEDSDQEVQPAICATATSPGELSDEDAWTLIHNASVRFRNESDPGTFNAEYPYGAWIQDAVDKRVAEGKPALPW